ncbi:hypothetical protein [Campylobacter troglodytis]|nr:hypothetical protein [Campylobacter troglodytis]
MPLLLALAAASSCLLALSVMKNARLKYKKRKDKNEKRRDQNRG